MPPDMPEIEIDEFTGKPRQAQPGQNSIVYQPLNRKLLYTKAEVDARIAAALAAIEPGVPDEAMSTKTVRMCDWSFGSYDDSVWNLGTGGAAGMKYRRVGRVVEGWLKVTIASDATTPSGFFIIVHPDDFPYTPKVESASSGYPMPGGFGAIYKADTAGSPPYNGYRHGLAPIVQEIGNGRAIMMFFKTGSESAIQAGADNT